MAGRTSDGRPAYEMLLTEGFFAGDYVDIFDGGPTVYADIDSVRTIRDARSACVTAIMAGGTASLVATGTGADFRVGRGGVTADGGIDPDLAETLGLSPGDPVLVVAA